MTATSLPARRARRRAILALPLALLAGGCSFFRPSYEERPLPPSLQQLLPPERPRPYPVFETPAFRRAVERGTRTRTGRPGPNHWTQHARYRLEARLDTAAKALAGRGTITYTNRSPDTLPVLYFHLHQNLFAQALERNETVPITGGMPLSRVVADGRALSPIAARDTGAGFVLSGRQLAVRLPRPLLPGQSAEVELDWRFVVPPEGAPRMGTDGEIYHLAYWYPQVAVYDDVTGWNLDPYLGNAEFYMGYADYDVSITLPAGMLVSATGTLENAGAVLAPRTRERLAEARRTGEVVRVVTADERGAGRATAAGGADGMLTWRYAARDQRDFAWGASGRWLWDATIALARDSAMLAAAGDTAAVARGARTGDTVMIHALYRPERIEWAWANAAEYGRHSIDFLSRYLWPYPYPHMSIVDGLVSCSGMEYPMITCIGGRRDTLSLYSVTVHEIAHMWFPMQVGSDERRHAWQDEGLTRFNQAQAMREYFRGYDLERIARNQYVAFAERGGEDVGGEVELMRHGDRYPIGTPAYGVASYAKMGTNLVSLRALLGDSLFLAAYRDYGRAWINRHPTPFDFFNAFERAAGRDLDWFWRTWWYETWGLDQAVASVEPVAGGTEIVVEDRGLAPMPVRLTLTMNDGSTVLRELPVEPWLEGRRRQTVVVPGTATRVVIDAAERFPDLDRSNNSWPRPAR